MEKTCAPESGTSSEENASGAAHRQGGEIMNHTNTLLISSGPFNSVGT